MEDYYNGRVKIINCMKHMEEEEKEYYQTHNSTEYFQYITESAQFQESFNRLENEDWYYLFEKLYLVTYKALNEEKNYLALDGVLYLFSKIGLFLSKKGTSSYHEFYKLLKVSQAPFLEKRVNDDLLYGLEIVMRYRDEEYLDILLRQHQEASVFRNHRDYLYQQDDLAKNGELPTGEIVAINCIERSYQREKELVLKY